MSELNRWTAAIAVTTILGIGVIAWVVSRKRPRRRDAPSNLPTSPPVEPILRPQPSPLVADLSARFEINDAAKIGEDSKPDGHDGAIGELALVSNVPDSSLSRPFSQVEFQSEELLQSPNTSEDTIQPVVDDGGAGDHVPGPHPVSDSIRVPEHPLLKPQTGAEYGIVGVIESEVEAPNVIVPPLTDAAGEESNQQSTIVAEISSATAEIEDIVAEPNRHTAEETDPAPTKEAIGIDHGLPEETGQSDQFKPQESRPIDFAVPFDISVEQLVENEVDDSEVAPPEVQSSITTEESDAAETDSTDVVSQPTIPQNGVETAEATDSSRPAVPIRKKAPPRYQPRVRTPQSTTVTRDSRKQERRAEAQRAQTLQMAVRGVADRRQRYTISLLPERIEDLGEEIKVTGPNGTETWTASWDHWYGGASDNNIGSLLENGNRWELRDDSESVNWVLSGRQVYVLGPSQTINALVTVPTLILNETHVVLCTQSQAALVAAALRNAGCVDPAPAETGAPMGWVLFKDIRPTIPVLHDEAAGILNALRPIHDVEIVFRGGIRLNYSTWLNGHPPRISIRGNTAEDVEVHIDGSLALRDAAGNFTTRDWDRLGFHTVFCGGVTQTYDLHDGQQSWETFEAFTYRSIQSRTTSRPIFVCGPLVGAGNDATLSLTPTGNTCVLGAVPGEIAFLPPNDLRTSERVAVTSFSAVWSLPANALTCNKSVARIQLLRPESGTTALPGPMSGSHGTVLWSQTILDASRKRLLVEPATEEALHLWAQYVQVARQLRRRQR